jgi:hypothetical protein
MADDVNVPKIGKVDKKILVPIVVAAGGFIGYRYWKARQSVGTGDEVAVDPGFEDMSGGLGPGVTRPGNDYGLPADDTSGATTGGFRGTTNSQWTEYVSDRLQQDGRWTYSVIAVALGNFLTAKPTTSEQQQIVQAAIGIAGYPPVSGYGLVTGGNTSITVAPTGVTATATPTAMKVSFAPVAGASSYNVYRSNSTGATNVATGTGASSPIDVVGLSPATSYSVQVAAVSASGQIGPKSSPINVKTPGVKMATPPKPGVSNVTATTAVLTTTPVTYATAYKWYVSGRLVASTPTPSWTATLMKPKTAYTAAVAAQSSGGTSPVSAKTSFKTR